MAKCLNSEVNFHVNVSFKIDWDGLICDSGLEEGFLVYNISVAEQVPSAL